MFTVPPRGEKFCLRSRPVKPKSHYTLPSRPIEKFHTYCTVPSRLAKYMLPHFTVPSRPISILFPAKHVPLVKKVPSRTVSNTSNREKPWYSTVVLLAALILLMVLL